MTSTKTVEKPRFGAGRGGEGIVIMSANANSCSSGCSLSL